MTEGIGRIRSRGGEAVTIRAGDVVSTPADEWHWHGAAPDQVMTHLSLTEGVADTGRPETDWAAHITDAEYGSS